MDFMQRCLCPEISKDSCFYLRGIDFQEVSLACAIHLIHRKSPDDKDIL